MANEKQNPNQDAEAQRLKKEEKARASRRRTRQLIGFALSILVVVGAASIVLGGINLVQGLLDTSGEKSEYEERFEPLVWFELIPFESVSQVDENSLKQAAIWGAYSKMGDKVERNERNEALIAASAVDQYGVELFGPDFRFAVHESFVDPIFDLRYGYDSATNMYILPVTSIQPEYLPTVVEVIRESGGVKRVVMGYVSTRTGDDQIVQTPDFEHPAFYMDYMLRRDGGEYYLFAIRPNTTHSSPTPAPTASTPQPQSLPAGESSSTYAPPSAPVAAPDGSEADGSEAAVPASTPSSSAASG